MSFIKKKKKPEKISGTEKPAAAVAWVLSVSRNYSEVFSASAFSFAYSQ